MYSCNPSCFDPILFPATYHRPLLHFLPHRRYRRRKGRRCPSRSSSRRPRRRRIPTAIIAHSRQSDEEPPPATIAFTNIARIQAATSSNGGRGPFTRCLAVVSIALRAIQPPPFHSLRRAARPFSSDKPIAQPRDEESEEWRRRPDRPSTCSFICTHTRCTVCARREIHTLPRDHLVFVRVDGLASSIARRSFSTMLSSPSVSVFLRLSLPLPRLDFD